MLNSNEIVLTIHVLCAAISFLSSMDLPRVSLVREDGLVQIDRIFDEAIPFS